MNKIEFDDIIKSNPTLTTHGFGVDNNGDFNKERAELSNCFDEAQKCELWLSLAKRTKHPNRKICSTLWLKSLVESWIHSYIHEGAFIAAALYLAQVRHFGCS